MPTNTNGIKRRSPLASLDSDNGDLFKRQKTHSTRTLSKTPSASNGKAKIFPSLREQREHLPIARGADLFFYISTMGLIFLPPGRESLIRSIASNNVTIVLGETGSGKTTRMFRYCFLVILSK